MFELKDTIEIVYFDTVLDQLIILESDAESVVKIVITMFGSEKLENIGTLGE